MKWFEPKKSQLIFKRFCFLAVELVLWLLVAGLGVGGFVFGMATGRHYVFVLGCALLIGSGALLWGFNGLLLDHQVSEVTDAGLILYEDVVVDMSNVGLTMLALVLIAGGVLSALAIDFGGSGQVRRNTYHY